MLKKITFRNIFGRLLFVGNDYLELLCGSAALEDLWRSRLPTLQAILRFNRFSVLAAKVILIVNN